MENINLLAKIMVCLLWHACVVPVCETVGMWLGVCVISFK